MANLLKLAEGMTGFSIKYEDLMKHLEAKKEKEKKEKEKEKEKK